MQNDDIQVLKEVQKNAEQAIKAIDTVSAKVYDDSLAIDLAGQSLRYSQIRNKAAGKIQEGKGELSRGNAVSDALLVGGIHGSTLLNTSTSRVAEVVIDHSNQGITNMCRSLNGNDRAGDGSLEIAKEFMDFEEESIQRVKRYL